MVDGTTVDFNIAVNRQLQFDMLSLTEVVGDLVRELKVRVSQQSSRRLLFVLVHNVYRQHKQLCSN